MTADGMTSVESLWRSIGRILTLPDATRLFTGHDYRPQGRSAAWESTVAEQRATNRHLQYDQRGRQPYLRNPYQSIPRVLGLE